MSSHGRCGDDLNDQQRLDLLEIFEERYRRKSTLITERGSARRDATFRDPARDKGYDSDAIRRQVEEKGAMPNIPPKANRH